MDGVVIDLLSKERQFLKKIKIAKHQLISCTTLKFGFMKNKVL